jgi:hypothetical protein
LVEFQGKEYGRDQADALFNLPANLICGQVTGDSARLVSERFGRILQDKNTFSTNSRDSSNSQSQHLEPAVPASKIATLSSGEFVGFTGDTSGQPIALKGFHCRVLADHHALCREEAAWQPLPLVHQVTDQDLQQNFAQVKEEVRRLVLKRFESISNNPLLQHLIITPKKSIQPNKGKDSH